MYYFTTIDLEKRILISKRIVQILKIIVTYKNPSTFNHYDQILYPKVIDV